MATANDHPGMLLMPVVAIHPLFAWLVPRLTEFWAFDLTVHAVQHKLWATCRNIVAGVRGEGGLNQPQQNEQGDKQAEPGIEQARFKASTAIVVPVEPFTARLLRAAFEGAQLEYGATAVGNFSSASATEDCLFCSSLLATTLQGFGCGTTFASVFLPPFQTLYCGPLQHPR